MESVVLQLQRECLDSRVPILDILRKALVVARKLSLADAQAWIEKELNGYHRSDAPPTHRLLTGQVRVRNPYHGWQPVIFEDPVEAERDSLGRGIFKGMSNIYSFLGMSTGVIKHGLNYQQRKEAY